ncbi:septal ring lytic transglycosylase RlpA family protein [Sphingobium sp. AS12]|uniref:septal ring lytic transglycosylase RlpA family protein n=1 Tax=Sphingobium sp. AS12 TaxID=2849495 RepID=UPI002674A575|nr:septal ring lytic transglycosylase RlpA family protein [Sphingobium sp. AS12]
MLFLASCGGGEQPRVPPTPSPRPLAQGGMVADEPVTIGAPYSVGGVTYTPEDAPNYDAVGYAGWYGEELQGNRTANGETFVPSAITAAHQTLPLPSYVEVTALDTGRTILVRVNDRGPFANDRIIDLSRGAAEQLGVIGDGAVAVRVRRVSPPDQERATLRGHGRVAERLETPPALLTALRAKLPGRLKKAAISAKPSLRTLPKPVRGPDLRESVPQPAPQDGFVVEQVGAPSAPQPVAPVAAPTPPRNYIVQVAAFASRARAETLAKRIGAQAVEGDGLWRVRFGPYATQDAAQAGVRAAAAKGFENGRIMANDAR